MFVVAYILAMVALLAMSLAHPLRNPSTNFSVAAHETALSCASNVSIEPLFPAQNFMQMAEAEQDKIITIPTVINFINKDGTPHRGFNDAEGIVTRLNNAYAPARIQFELRVWTEIVNDEWATASVEQLSEFAQVPTNDMTGRLHQGGYDTLNLYYPSHASGAYLGVCDSPQLDPTEHQIESSGCIVAGSRYDEDNAATAVHEVGHWLGLDHTFDLLDCDDNIADTPPSGFPSGGSGNSDKDALCPLVRNCIGLPVGQIAHNWMDYIPASCMDEFTPMQMQRMRLAYRGLREGKSA